MRRGLVEERAVSSDARVKNAWTSQLRHSLLLTAARDHHVVTAIVAVSDALHTVDLSSIAHAREAPVGACPHVVWNRVRGSLTHERRLRHEVSTRAANNPSQAGFVCAEGW